MAFNSETRLKTVGFGETFVTGLFQTLSFINVGNNTGTAGGSISVANGTDTPVLYPYGLGFQIDDNGNPNDSLTIVCPADAMAQIMWK